MEPITDDEWREIAALYPGLSFAEDLLRDTLGPAAVGRFRALALARLWRGEGRYAAARALDAVLRDPPAE